MQLEPFPYHLAIAERLERGELELWRWFQSEHIGQRYQELTRADLQQSASRLPPGGANETLYACAGAACVRLGVEAPVSLFRLQDAAAPPRAFLVYLPGEILVALTGSMLAQIGTEAEQLAAMGREIARYGLYQANDGCIHIANRMLHWFVQQDGCRAELFETFRRFRLMTEIFCDIGGYMACEDRAAVMRVLLKADPNAKAGDTEIYLESAGSTVADPAGANASGWRSELAVRALALARSTAAGPGGFHIGVEDLIAGPVELGSLDLIEQESLLELTRKVLTRVLPEAAAGAPAALVLAREMFPDYAPVAGAQPLNPPARPLSSSIADYLAYLLLDLATAQGTSFRNAVAVAATAADELGIGTRFREIARQELRGRRGLQAGLAGRAA